MSSYSYSQSYVGNGTTSNDLSAIIPLLVSYSLVFVTGVLGNFIVLFSIYKSRRLHTITCIFLANLAIVDFIVCLVVVPIQIGQEFFSEWPFGAALCKLTSYMMMMNPACSVFTLTLISFERFYVVLYPLKAKSVLTFRRAKVALFVVWVSACVFSVPNIVKQSIVPRGNTIVCRIGWKPDSTEYRLYVTSNLIFLLLIPVAMMMIAYTSVIYALYKNKKATAGRKQSSSGRTSLSSYNGGARLEVIPLEDESSSTSTLMSDFSPVRVLNRNSDHSPARGAIRYKEVSPSRGVNRNKNQRRCKTKRLRFVINGEGEERDADADRVKRIVIMLIVIVLLFVLCWTPLLTINFLLKFAIIEPSYETLIVLSATSHLLAFTNSCFNPFVYALMSKNFRESMKQVFRQCWRRNNRTGIHHRPSLSSTRVSRSGTAVPRWKNVRNANEAHV